MTSVSGSPKRTLYSSNLGTLGSQHHPGVEDAAKINGRACAVRPPWARPTTRHDFFDEFAGHYFHGRVGAHAAGVRSGVGVATRLKSWAGASAKARVPSKSTVKRTLLAVEPFFDDHVVPASPEGSTTQFLHDVTSGSARYA